jgi:hypothetical protein
LKTKSVPTVAAFAGLFAAMACAGPAFADCAPPKLIRMVTSLVAIGVAPGFQNKSKVQYRLGNGRTRLEEQPDPEEGVHLLLITDAPMAWTIDLVTQTGTVDRDTDVPSVVRAPVFSDDKLPKEIQQLEFGCEADFIASPDTTHARMESTKVEAMKHSVVSGKWKATLFVPEGSTVPHSAMLSENGKVVAAIRYHSYETLEQVPEGLFAPPVGITIK